jgi:Histidine phosphatase superfamily (branch 1)
MLQRLSLIAFSGLALALTAMPSMAQSAMRDVLEDMKKGGYVVVVRHGRTNESADTKDASPLDLSNCTGQLLLNEVGKRQAQAIGEAFKKAEVPVGKVIASTYCRAMETGRLAFGKAEPSDALLLEAFVPAPGTPVPPPWPQRVEMMKELVAAAPAVGTNTVLITHFPNVKAALGVQIGFGDAAIVKPDGHGGAIVVARITAKEWAAF